MEIDFSLDKIITKAFDGFKKITPLLSSCLILTGLILFLPESILEKMALNNLPDLWKNIFGVVFLLCAALTSTIVLFSLMKRISAKYKLWRFRNIQIKKYKRMSERQKRIIVQLLESRDKTIQLDSNSGDTIYLINNGFIHQPQQIVSVGYRDRVILSYVPELWLLDLYNKSPKMFSKETTAQQS